MSKSNPLKKPWGLQTIEKEDGKIFAHCRGIDGKPSKFEITEDQMHRLITWKAGEGPIQRILPDLTPDQRELCISGTSDEDWETQ